MRDEGEQQMKNKLAISAIALSLASSAAIAGERPTDAALGAVSGAVVFGPIGAVAGAIVGYTAGPSISHPWRRSGRARQASKATRQEARADASNGQPAPRTETAPPTASATPISQESPKAAPITLPPVQGLE
jgi:hypothetical protein